ACANRFSRKAPGRDRCFVQVIVRVHCECPLTVFAGSYPQEPKARLNPAAGAGAGCGGCPGVSGQPSGAPAGPSRALLTSIRLEAVEWAHMQSSERARAMQSANSTNAEQAKHWSGAGADGWIELKAMIDKSFVPFTELLLADCSAGPTSRLLDVGCGT